MEPIANDLASSFTHKANVAAASRLPLNNQEDFKNAKHGLIAQIPDGVIRADDGNIVWDMRDYQFLEGPCPSTVHPSLWRMARLNAFHGLFAVADGVYQVRGYDYAAMTVIRGAEGWIVVDPLTTVETSRAAMQLVREYLGDRKVSAVLYTHSHPDHFGGVKGVLDERDVMRGDAQIYAPAGLVEAIGSEGIVAGNHMARRAMYQFGLRLPRGPHGLVDGGIGKELAKGTRTYIAPTHFVTATNEKRTIDGVEFVFQICSGSEAPAEFTFFLPEFQVLCMSEVCNHTMHNILTLRGAEVRDPLLWSRYIDEAIVLFSEKAVAICNSHNWPEFGSENVIRFLEEQRDIYKYIHDQTLRLANLGHTPIEIAEMVSEPEFMRQSFAVRGYYGTLNHNTKATYQKYFGYFDGNPSNLAPLPPEVEGKKYVSAFGGMDSILEKADAALAEGDYRWAATLLKHAVFAQPDHDLAKSKLAFTYEQLGYQSESIIWRNIYLTAALEIKTGIQKAARGVGGRNPDVAKSISLLTYFDSIATRLNAERADGKFLALNFVMKDSGDQVAVWIKRAVENVRLGTHLPKADVEVHITRAELDALIVEGQSLDDKISIGTVSAIGSLDTFKTYLALHDRFDLWFNVATP